LEREGFEVEAVDDGVTALQAFHAHGADLVLLDLMIPGIPGDQVCRQLRTISDVPVIMVSAKGSEIDKIIGLELGADDYVTKPYSFRELLARIRAVLRRRVAGDNAARQYATGTLGLEPIPVQRVDDIELDIEAHTLTVAGELVKLPLKEFDLLELLMRNQGRVLTRSQLIDEVWGSTYVGDTKTLDVHIKRLRSKIEQDPAHPRHLLTIRGLGYKFN
jgi:two-component system response regulator RegX3